MKLLKVNYQNKQLLLLKEDDINIYIYISIDIYYKSINKLF